MSLSQKPGLLTAHQPPDAARLRLLRSYGYEWVSYQVQNGDLARDFDLRPAREAGFIPTAWGVTYDQSRFYQNGFLLGKQAVLLGAQGEVVMDAEFCAKFTRDQRLMRPIIQGVRDAGWSGPVSLNTMGPPWNPDVNDYAIDVESFLETGGCVYTQAYANETDAFLPSLAVKYWTRVGVPRDRLGVGISLYPSEPDKQFPNRRFGGSEWAMLLDEAGVKRDFHVFMQEAATDQDLNGLRRKSYVEPDAPPPQPSVDVNANYERAGDALAESVGAWRVRGKDELYVRTRRQYIALRVLMAAQDARNMSALDALLDDIDAPRP